ncbi:TadE/TadG family type IV pilus assembly protein [Anianabacter salinae]|uniref:TadE/TadG family type IV pilus assembly protein n=1 Tax=Anianabacter salinae TaxID=2851023 RepID=UPI00225DF2DD|nr:TadE/TadG family type IV pilus assembly protein [Anianabacter salinae]MBV0912804.1 hypothetical protein [Anianabacter salinae]
MIRAIVHKFLRREDAFTSIQFVFLLPLVTLVMGLTIEAGVLATRQVMLDRALAEASRTLKLRSGLLPSQAALIQQVCDTAVVFPDCTNSLTVEVAPIDTVAWDIGAEYIECIDLDDPGFVPANEFRGGSDNTLVMLRICATFEPLFPYVGLGAKLRRTGERDYTIASAIAYVNEPR